MRLLWEPPWRATRRQNAQGLIRWPYGIPGACPADAVVPPLEAWPVARGAAPTASRPSATVVPPNIASALLAGGMLAFARSFDEAMSPPSPPPAASRTRFRGR